MADNRDQTPESPDRPLPAGIADPDHGTRTRTSDRPEFDAGEDAMRDGMSTEAAAVDAGETMASTGDSDSMFREVASGTATGLGVDRGEAVGVGGLAAGEDLDPVAEGDYWREAFASRPYYDASRSYEDYEPGYRLGWETAADPENAGTAFEEVEPDLRLKWERGEIEGDTRRGADALTWEEMREAALDAWQRIRHGIEEPSL
jgi:hypothetical protein